MPSAPTSCLNQLSSESLCARATEAAHSHHDEQQQQLLNYENENTRNRKLSFNSFTKQYPHLQHSHPSIQKFIHLMTSEFKRGHATPERVVDEKQIMQLFEEFCCGEEAFHLEDLLQYCYFDSESSYTRNLVFENEHFSLLVLVWTPESAR
jgi:hypothetical protein